MELSQRLKELRAQKGWTQSDLAKMSSVSIDSIKGYEMGKTKNITIENLKKIASAFNLNPNNFYTEILSTNLSTKNKNFVDQSVDQSKKLSVNMSNNPSNLKKLQIEQIESDQIYIRQLSSSVGAGESVEINGIEIYDTDILIPFSQMLFKVRPKNTEHVRCMRVDGYSMAPMLFPDSWVIADVTAKFTGDGLYIINYCDNFMVKLLQKAPDGTLSIISTNKDYKSYEIGPDDEAEVYIVGKVLRCVI
ncbi:helix-turn-helix domain-containing protein [Campylobacter sp. RM12920]|uniref:Helix-turn-helix domain-containing protein n=2 Tax=Campylobacter californiensis TaxID=1032243 RepID=A0ABD4JG62_9BACT|nr:helix-turn-helix domain-containing protein [Campylobacter sp. RM12919]MBE2987446.1 helix-turn-helix domain-containing protein [Campylobacter sp. RM12920]